MRSPTFGRMTNTAHTQDAPGAAAQSGSGRTCDPMAERCFACDRKLGRSPLLVDTRDGQLVYVGRECAKMIRAGGSAGWQPPKGGPRLWVLP